MRKFFGLSLILFGTLATLVLILDMTRSQDPYRYFKNPLRTENLQLPSHWRSQEANVDKMYSQRLHAKEIMITDSRGRTRIRLGVNARDEAVVEIFDERGRSRALIQPKL